MSELFKVSLKNCKVSPKKAVLVANRIRGLNIDQAAGILRYMPNKSATLFFKLIKSISANIENNHGQEYSEFVVSEVSVSKGQVLKRLRQRAKGRADRQLKRYSHLYITAQSK